MHPGRHTPLVLLAGLYAGLLSGAAFADGLGDIGQIEQGAAATIQAAAPAVEAGVEAGADVKIAGINASASVDQTQIQSNTSEYLANDEKDAALAQSYAQENIAFMNNAGQTTRTLMQVIEQEDANRDQLQAQEEKMALDYQYNQQRIAIAQKEAYNNEVMAALAAKYQITEAGLVNTTEAASPDRLTVSKTGVGGGSASAAVGTNRLLTPFQDGSPAIQAEGAPRADYDLSQTLNSNTFVRGSTSQTRALIADDSAATLATPVPPLVASNESSVPRVARRSVIYMDSNGGADSDSGSDAPADYSESASTGGGHFKQQGGGSARSGVRTTSAYPQGE